MSRPTPLSHIALLACASITISCASSPGAADSKETDETQAEADSAEAPESDETQTLVTDISRLPDTFDTGVMSGAAAGRVAFNIYEGLLMPAATTRGVATPEGHVRPGVAESWEVSEDGIVYTFHLRDDARWSNGEPVVAADFERAWKYVLSPDTPADYPGLLHVIDNASDYQRAADTAEPLPWDEVGVDVVDARTLRVTLEHPAPYFLELVAFYTMFPQPPTGPPSGTRPPRITNGAYRVEAIPGDEIVLVESSTYWDAKNTDIARVRLRVFDTPAAKLRAFERGHLDAVLTHMPASASARENLETAMMREPLLGTYYFRINVSDANSPLAAPKFRRALAASIDRSAIVYEETHGRFSNPLRSIVPRDMPGYTRPVMPPYNAETARSLLEAAGYSDVDKLPTFQLLYNTNDTHRNIAQAAASHWDSALGIDVEPVDRAWKIYLRDVALLDYEIARAGWIGDYNDPTTFLEMWTTGHSNNDTGWSNPTYDQLLEKARQEHDFAKRAALLQRAEQLLLLEGPVIPIAQYQTTHLVAPKVRGLQPHNRDIHQYKDLRLVE